MIPHWLDVTMPGLIAITALYLGATCGFAFWQAAGSEYGKQAAGGDASAILGLVIVVMLGPIIVPVGIMLGLVALAFRVARYARGDKP